RDRRMGIARRTGIAACAALALGACRDRAGAPADEAPADTGKGGGGAGSVQVRLMAPDTLGWNETDTVRLVVTNATGQPLRDAVLNLFVAAPAEAAVDSAAPAAARPEAVASGEGTRLTFAVPVVEPGRTAGFVQAVRTPPAPAAPVPGGRPATRGATPTLYLVRAWLSTRGGSPVGAPVQDTVRIRAGSEVVAGGCGNVGDVTVSRYGVGPVRIGMTLDELRSACPETRDTTWEQEGMKETGAIAAPGGKRIVAVLAGGKIARIVVDQPGLRTSAGLSVGATVGDLRARYGRMCAGVGEGRVAVWFPNAPGLSFGLDTLATRRWDLSRTDPDSIPDDVGVGSFWVRQGTDDCPAGGGDR
ncbi:MAG TPA: hypothetical protein VFR81_22585, partial [Longimicrobium sp.]|nr:hypothetical protein [Longimicrobium sp.]